MLAGTSISTQHGTLPLLCALQHPPSPPATASLPHYRKKKGGEEERRRGMCICMWGNPVEKATAPHTPHTYSHAFWKEGRKRRRAHLSGQGREGTAPLRPRATSFMRCPTEHQAGTSSAVERGTRAFLGCPTSAAPADRLLSTCLSRSSTHGPHCIQRRARRGGRSQDRRKAALAKRNTFC